MRRTWFICLIGFLAFILSSAAHAETPQSRQQITLSFAPLVKQAAPAVVNIYTQKVVRQRVSPLFEDPLFRQFFGNMIPPGMSRERLENSLGSGVIVKPDGIIVTSNHVIAGADQIRVVLSDRREFDATALTTDEHSDLAILRIDAKGEKLPFLEIRDSDEAEIGDLVLAIGNPFGVGQTVTSGIISAVAHRAVGGSDLDYFIQTDAAINPGNSGGALITMDGRLVGINAAIYSQSGGNIGIGFAVPSNMVRVALSAVEHGQKSIVRPWIGIEGQAVTAELAASLNMAQPSGLLVNRINAASPAAKAGVAVGDVIAAVNGRAVEDPESFRYRLATMPVGSSVDFALLRKGQKLDVSVKLIAPPEEPPRQKTRVTGRNPLGGAEIENLSPAVSEETGLRNLEHGVIVTGVKEGMAASNIGLQAGDVVLSINGAKIADVNAAMAAVRAEASRWRVVFQRGDEKMTIVVGG
jgi:Do/DeqQ family serine protease